FQESTLGWSASGPWHIHTDGASGSCSQVHSFEGTKAWYFFTGQESNCNYSSGPTTTTPSGTIESEAIPSVDALTTLSFMYWRESRSTVQQPGQHKDAFDVTVAGSVDGYQAWHKIFSLDSDDISWAAWRSSGALSLAAFAGQSVKIRFTFTPS